MTTTTTLTRLLDARESLLRAIDKSTIADVLTHALNAVAELDKAIAILGARIPELQDEVAALRPAICVPDRIPEELH